MMESFVVKFVLGYHRREIMFGYLSQPWWLTFERTIMLFHKMSLCAPKTQHHARGKCYVKVKCYLGHFYVHLLQKNNGCDQSFPVFWLKSTYYVNF